MIPAMDHIDDRLAQIGLNEDILPAVRAAASLGRKTCNRYYATTDDSPMCRFAISTYTARILYRSANHVAYTRSLPSLLEVGLLQAGWMGSGMDQKGQGFAPPRIRQQVR